MNSTTDNNKRFNLNPILVFLMIATLLSFSKSQLLPEGFVYLNDIEPGIAVELRYATNNNFIGIPIDGYLSEKVILTKETALALQKAHRDLNRMGYGIKVFDTYRPQRAVNHFTRWAKDQNDTLKKREYYPNVFKKDLFTKGYIASKSGHSRGSTVDITIIDITTKEELDMGSLYDFFGKESHTYYQNISEVQRKNRALLRSIMIKHNFKIYSEEWWHFTLRNEPFPNTYFDFPVL